MFVNNKMLAFLEISHMLVFVFSLISLYYEDIFSFKHMYKTLIFFFLIVLFNAADDYLIGWK